jgi:hypothetical protein
MIDRISGMTEKDFKVIYQNLVHSINTTEEQILLNYFGVISDDLIHSLGLTMEDLLISYSIPKKQIKKLFSILVEGLKNILLYGEQSNLNEKFGCVLVVKTVTQFKVLFGNPINFKVQPVLESYIQTIINFNNKQLISKYIETLENSFVKNVSESGVGLLVMALNSDSGISYDFIKINHQGYLFLTEVSIHKSDNKI